MTEISENMKSSLELLDSVIDEDRYNFDLIWKIIDRIINGDKIQVDQDLAEVFDTTFGKPIGLAIEFVLSSSGEVIAKLETKHRIKYMSLSSCFRHAFLNYYRFVTTSPNAISNIKTQQENINEMKLIRTDGNSFDVYVDMPGGCYLIAIISGIITSLYQDEDSVTEGDKQAFETIIREVTKIGRELGIGELDED
ncbi:hypothetical protein [Paenibacillus solani]|uniref:hypothetical protein n=1 Tax=Paenibacillus solani TaxID=1705565 RepID=UPI003D268ECB